MSTPIVRVIVALCMGGVFSPVVSGQSLATTPQEQARFLLRQIEQRLSKITYFRCQRVAPLPPLPGTEDTAPPRYRQAWLAADRQGLGWIRSSEDGRIATQMWDGQNTIEHTVIIDPNGAVSHQVYMAEGMQFPMQLYNEPWVYLGSELANLLTEAIEKNRLIRITQTMSGQYRVDIRDGEGALHTAVLDPQQDYLPVYRRIYAGGKITALDTITFQKVKTIRGGTDVWFPFEVQTEVGPQEERLSSPTLKCRFTDVSINDFDFQRSLRLGLEPGTKVYDRVRSRTYVVGEEATQSQNQTTAAPSETITPAPTPETQTPPSQPALPDWRATFNATYELKPGQNLKCVPPPFIPERTRYLTAGASDDTARTAQALDNQLYQFEWDNGLRGGTSLTANRMLELSVILEKVIGLNSYEYAGQAHLLSLPLTGDWVVRKDASTEQLLAALEQIVQDQKQWSIGFARKPVEAIVIRASGRYQFHALPQAPRGNIIHVYAGNAAALRGDMAQDNACGTVARLLNEVANAIGMPIIDNTQSSNTPSCWVNHTSAQLRSNRDTPSLYNTQLASLLNNLTGQTGLSFQIELGTVNRWQISFQRSITASSR